METVPLIIITLAAVFSGGEGGYILTAPQVLLGGSVERICLSLEGVDEDLILHLMLVDKVAIAVEQHYMFAKGENQGCVELSIPLAPHGDDRHVTLWATGISEGYNFSSSTPVIMRNDPTITFIQTDKPLYNPGQTVKFRILTVDVNLKPLLRPVSEISILDPNGVRLIQWRNATGEDGLVSEEMELSEEPVLGEWTIEAYINNRRQAQTFKVQEYVLPKFEVIVKPPPFLLANSPSITAEICAQYTYGKKVKGIMDVEVCIKSPPLSSIDLLNEPPCDKVKEKIDGCRMFTLDSKLVNLGSAEFPFWDHRVYINASVTETATGVTQYGFSNSAKLMQEALKLDFAKSSKYFKPGLPYKGKLRVKRPDGKPAPNEPIKVAAVDYESGVRAEDVFVSNKDGEVYFVLPGELLLVSKEVTLLAEAIRYKDSADLDGQDRHIMYQPTAIIKLRAWYSRSKSFIQIFPVEEAAECGKELTVGVAYTTTPGSYIKFHYQVVSRGNIVKTGHKMQHFNLHIFDRDNAEGILKVQKHTGYTDPPAWLDKEPLAPEHFFKEAFPNLETPGKTDPGDAKVPVEEEEIVPKHFQPLGNLPDPEDNPFAGREPVSEDFIQPEYFEPLGKIPLPDFGADPAAGRQPAEEDLIQPKHYEPLGEKASPGGGPNPYAGRQPVNEEFIQPKHYQPLENNKKSKKKRQVELPADYVDYYDDPIKEGDKITFNKEETTFDESTHVSHVQLNIPVTPEMAPEAQLLVYYVRVLDGETVADSVSFKVKRCFENEVEFKFKKPKVRPGKKTTVRVKAKPGSLCGISVVDKSVNLAGGNSLLTPEKVFKQLAKYEIGKHHGEDEEYCRSKMVSMPDDLEFPSLSDIIGPPGSNLPPLPATPKPDVGHGPPALGRVRRKRSPFNPRRRQRKLQRRLRNLQLLGRGPRSSPPFFQGSTYFSPYVDAIKAFRSAGLVTLTDLALETRPCEVRDIDDPILHMDFDDGIRRVPGPGGPLLEAAIDSTLDVERDIVIGEGDDSEDVIRSYFPETWLWDLMRIGDTGMGLLTRPIPDTITEWEGGVLCTNPTAGMGVSNKASVTTFQPFFISYTLPYSAIRGERLPVLITIFNYMTDCLEIKLSLKKSRKFEVGAGDSPQNFCVCGGKPVTHKFYIIPKALGKIRIAVDSRSVNPSGICRSNNSTVSSKLVKARDRVVKKLLVEAEGIPQEYTYSSLVCPRDQPGGIFEDNIKLKLPPNAVPGSARAYFTVTGDLMGPTVNGLEKLIQLPTGCGEQNMLNFAPNIYILQYLQGTQQLTPQVEEKTKDFMKKGYQRELTYRHQDGSYSAFGESDETGSMWLTAFVVKSFAQAQPYLYIDREDLEKSMDWFQMRQLDSGCFPAVGQVVHKEMKGGLSDALQGQAALTAYVLIAMLEAGISMEHPSVQKAVRCIEAANINDTYTIALAAYAITLYDVDSSLRAKLMNKLHHKGTFENGLLHWERETTPLVQSDSEWQKPYTQAASTEVEMTAYALLAYITGDQPNSVMLARPIVQWLTKQRNAQGGFTSTQDTVVALQALAAFSTKVYSDGKDIQFSTEGTRFRRKFNVTDEDKLLLKSARIHRVPNQIKVKAEGIGCALVQTSLRYNVASQSLTLPPFEIKVNVFRSKSDINDCKKQTINICTRYTGPGYVSNMVIVEVKMLTGWVPIKESIVPVTMVDRLGIKRFEIDNNFVNFYFDEMTSQRRCFEFEVYQEVKLSAPKDAPITVFDYYETDQTVTTMYKIKTICGTKEEIPFEITDNVGPMRGGSRVESDLFDFPEQRREPPSFGQPGGMEDPFFISQRRVEPVLPPFLVKKLKAAKEKAEQAKKDCPICATGRPEDFPQRYCSAQHAYKTITGRQGKFPLKLQSDFRPKKGKVPVDGFSNISLKPECECPVIHKKGWVMILAPKGAYSQKLLTLNSSITVVPVSKEIEREARVLSAGSCVI